MNGKCEETATGRAKEKHRAPPVRRIAQVPRKPTHNQLNKPFTPRKLHEAPVPEQWGLSSNIIHS
jgi:hypothetical protein